MAHLGREVVSGNGAGGGAVRAGCYEKVRGFFIYYAGQVVEDERCWGRAGCVIDQEEKILSFVQKFPHCPGCERMGQGLFQDLALIPLRFFIGKADPRQVLLRAIDLHRALPIRYCDIHHFTCKVRMRLMAPLNSNDRGMARFPTV